MSPHRREWLGVLFLATAVALSFQGTRGLYETTEGRYAECAREMLESGNYLEPTLGYRPHWTKPPLTYWSIAAGMTLLGENEWGVRMYNALAFVLTALCVVAVGDTLFGPTTGIAAGLIYATSPFTAVAAYVASTDTLLALWTTLALLCFAKQWKASEDGKLSRLWVCGMWASFGLGFATKGPPALLPLLPILICRFRRRWTFKMVTVCGLLAFVLIGLSWYGIVALRNEGLLAYFVRTEVADRLLSTDVHNDEWYNGFAVYLPVLILGPGWWLYPAVKGLHRRKIRRPSQVVSYARGDARYDFLLLSLVVPLCVLLVARSKLHLYVLPLFAPLSVLLARTFADTSLSQGTSRRVWRLACIGCVLMICIKGALAFAHPVQNIKDLAHLCWRHDSGDTEYVAVNTPKLYGLQYYLRGRLIRVSTYGSEPWVDMSLPAMMDRIAGAGSAADQVLITPRSETESLMEMLKLRSVQYTTDESPYYTLFILSGADRRDGARDEREPQGHATPANREKDML